MDYKQELNNNAKGALCMMISHADYFYNLTNFKVESIGDLYVIWRNRKNVKELALDDIQDHEKLIEHFKNIILSSPSFTTTIFAMRKSDNSPTVVADGIHRIIGTQRALSEQPNVKRKIKISMLLFEGKKINELEDYTLSIPV